MGCTLFKLKKRSMLFVCVLSLTLHRKIEVYEVSVKLRSVYTGELHLVTDDQTAAPFCRRSVAVLSPSPTVKRA